MNHHSLAKRLVVLCTLMLSITAISHGQEAIDNFLERYSGNDADEYVQPLADAIGANFNSGWIHTTDIAPMKFQLYFGLIVQNAFIPDKQRTFNATTPEYFRPRTQAEVSTILGPTTNVIVQGENGTAYAFPGGVGATMLPVATPQLTIGSVFGTQASFRFLAFDIGGDIGKLDLFGWGVRHSVSQWLPEDFPVGIVVGYFGNRFDVENLETRNHIALAFASWKYGVLELYGGPGFEWGSFDYTYDSTVSEQEETIDIKHGNSIRFTAGATLNLGVFTLNFDYNLAKQHAISAGVGIGIGKTKSE